MRIAWRAVRAVARVPVGTITRGAIRTIAWLAVWATSRTIGAIPRAIGTIARTIAGAVAGIAAGSVARSIAWIAARSTARSRRGGRAVWGRRRASARAIGHGWAAGIHRGWRLRDHRHVRVGRARTLVAICVARAREIFRGGLPGCRLATRLRRGQFADDLRGVARSRVGEDAHGPDVVVGQIGWRLGERAGGAEQEGQWYQGSAHPRELALTTRALAVIRGPMACRRESAAWRGVGGQRVPFPATLQNEKGRVIAHPPSVSHRALSRFASKSGMSPFTRRRPCGAFPLPR
jgi:hypothetical protein